MMNLEWMSGQWKYTQPFTPGMVIELLIAAALVPMAFTDLRAEVDGRVIASGSSSTGGGLHA